jgi:2-(1,2-epoxy-1,2-dihydrophenyl)acetyl-CoA isomerase
MTTVFGDVQLETGTSHVATVTISRPPNNFFDADLIESLAAAYEACDADPDCRAIVLRSEGKHFCAGAQFRVGAAREDDPKRLYGHAVRLFRAATPVVAAIQGAAIGGGLGLACSADFRVACPEARFAANFARLGFHHGFGLTVTLPRIVGFQAATELLYTGRRIDGSAAQVIGLADYLVDSASLLARAHELAAEVAAAAPLAVTAIRATMRDGLAAAVEAATGTELREQDRLRHTEDWREGIRASSERREPRFTGR